MKQFLDHALLASLLYIFFLFSRHTLWQLSFLLCIVFYHLRVKNRSSIIFSVLLLLSCISFSKDTYSGWTEGRVIKVSTNYVVVTNDHEKLLLYTKALPLYDATISFSGQAEPLTSRKGFYAFDFANWTAEQGITYAMTPDTMTEVRQRISFRSLLQKKINSLSDEQWKSILFQVLLGIRPQELVFSSFLAESGFSLLGVLQCIEAILRYFVKDRRRNQIVLSITIMMMVFYHFPYLLVQKCIFVLLKQTKITTQNRIGIGYLIGLFLYPHIVTSVSFLLPACFRYSSCLFEKYRKKSFLFSCILQSVLFHRVNPVQMLCYRYLVTFLGLYWLLALVSLLFAWNLTALFVGLDRCLSFLNIFQIKGSMLGAGAVFYLLMVYCSRKMKYADLYHILLFFFFLWTGLFHPFASVTMINVGQGSSMLIRQPCNRGNILIDTGKPEQYTAVQTLLDALSIHQIDTLIITHQDSDHSGNQEAVSRDYKVRQVMTTHQKETKIKGFTIYDLNEIANENENQSSIVSYFALNDLRFLCMGDADEEGEKAIITKYDSLKTDILICGHHGSKTSSSEEFLDTVQPELALISSGAYAIYHHPSPIVTKRLTDRLIPYFDTKEEGDMSIICLPGMNLFITSLGKIALLR